MRRRPAFAAGLVALGLALAGCGGGSGSPSSTLPKLDVPLSKSSAITSANVAIIGAGNATSNLLSNPSAAARGRQLLKPLILAKTLKVGPGNQAAGGLVQSIDAQLDNTVPGLTTQSGALDGDLVHRFLLYGEKDPKKVFETKALAGAAQLARLMRGLPAKAIVNDSQPPQTSADVVAADLKIAKAYWPAVANRLEAVQASLR